MRNCTLERLEDRRLLATFIVTSAADAGAGSLRDVVAQTNAAAGADQIRFDFATDTINLTGSEIAITDALALVGPANSPVTINATGNSRVFAIDASAGSVQIDRLHFENGNATNGGAILAASGVELSVRDSVFHNNQADDFGGAIYGANITLRLDGVSFTQNQADYAGAVLASGDIGVANSNFSANRAETAGAMAAFSSSGGNEPVRLANVDFLANRSRIGAGALLVNARHLGIEDSRFIGNISEGVGIDSADGYGGALYAYGSTDQPAETVNFLRVVIENNTANTGGGGAAISRVGDVVIEESRFASNQLLGTIANGFGGGLSLFQADSLTLRNSEVAGNNAGPNGDGGGASLSGVDDVLIENSTFARNQATLYGAMRHSPRFSADSPNASLTLLQTTVTENSADTVGGVGVRILSGTASSSFELSVVNSIVAGNVEPVGGTTPSNFDVTSTSPATIFTTFAGTNLLGTDLASDPDAAGSIFANDPVLRPLGFYGGPTRTMPPMLDASPAFNAGVNTFAADLNTDQRAGFVPRIVYGQVDIGAAEAVLAGDANFDGRVDLSDFVILRNNFGSNASVFANADFNGDGTVDLADFVILRNNFGRDLEL